MRKRHDEDKRTQRSDKRCRRARGPLQPRARRRRRLPESREVTRQAAVLLEDQGQLALVSVYDVAPALGGKPDDLRPHQLNPLASDGRSPAAV